ncbi:hypothetical protein [Candidatus Allofournierella merdavium]|uniref:hypothetical protein n=1 Tax=Candidatus Allofournierella merdavium TaxID=2838593 RepID=UPI00374F1228
MKKVLALVMVLALALSFTACGGSAKKVKTGIAIVSSYTTADATADAAGNAQVDSTVAAVTVDESGKIVACKIDVAQNKVPVNADGTFDTSLTFKSKQELGTDYGMTPASAIGKEWYEQADAFAAYVVGKTAAEVEAIGVTGDHNAPDVADLAASCTMNVVDIKAAIVEACNNAQDLGASADDTLGLGLSTEMSSSKLPTADEAGLVQTDTTYAAVTYDKDGKITSTVLNCTQAKMDVTAEGVVTARGDSIVPKQEQGDDYGMRAASAIGKEWNEQADAFAAYLTGKTAAEVSAIGVTGDHNAPDVADLSASCTMNVLGFIDAVGRAMA